MDNSTYHSRIPRQAPALLAEGLQGKGRLQRWVAQNAEYRFPRGERWSPIPVWRAEMPGQMAVDGLFEVETITSQLINQLLY